MFTPSSLTFRRHTYHIIIMMKSGSNGPDVWFEAPPVVSRKQAIQAQGMRKTE